MVVILGNNDAIQEEGIYLLNGTWRITMTYCHMF